MTKNVMLLYICKPFTPPHTHNALKIHYIENSAPHGVQVSNFFFLITSPYYSRAHTHQVADMDDVGCFAAWR